MTALEIQEALSSQFEKLARFDGGDPQAVGEALLALALSNLAALKCNRDTEAAIRKAWQQVHGLEIDDVQSV